MTTGRGCWTTAAARAAAADTSGAGRGRRTRAATGEDRAQGTGSQYSVQGAGHHQPPGQDPRRRVLRPRLQPRHSAHRARPPGHSLQQPGQRHAGRVGASLHKVSSRHLPLLRSHDLSGSLLHGEPSPRQEVAFIQSSASDTFRRLHALRLGEYKAHFYTEGNIFSANEDLSCIGLRKVTSRLKLLDILFHLIKSNSVYVCVGALAAAAVQRGARPQ